MWSATLLFKLRNGNDFSLKKGGHKDLKTEKVWFKLMINRMSIFAESPHN
jgi:hypothetical protein